MFDHIQFWPIIIAFLNKNISPILMFYISPKHMRMNTESLIITVECYMLLAVNSVSTAIQGLFFIWVFEFIPLNSMCLSTAW